MRLQNSVSVFLLCTIAFPVRQVQLREAFELVPETWRTETRDGEKLTERAVARDPAIKETRDREKRRYVCATERKVVLLAAERCEGW